MKVRTVIYNAHQIKENWWKSKAKYYHIGGSFNNDLYRRICQIKLTLTK